MMKNEYNFIIENECYKINVDGNCITVEEKYYGGNKCILSHKCDTPYHLPDRTYTRPLFSETTVGGGETHSDSVRMGVTTS